MDPLIKWPGGKSRELKVITKEIPEYVRFFEPFFGGGAVGFELEPSKAIVNDIDSLLIQFYRDTQTKNEDFLNELDDIIRDWRRIEHLVNPIEQTYLDLFDLELENMKANEILPEIKALFAEQEDSLKEIVEQLARVNPQEFWTYLTDSIASKTKRIIKLQHKHNTIFDNDLLKDHLMTAVKAAYYTQIRNDIFNKNATSATFFFIREFCYGSMFRFNSKGEFNIPYGGINYNFKDIEQKVQNLTSTQIQATLTNFEFHSLDFNEFFKERKPSSDDFIFLDPPYDTDFKNYGKNPFGENDQVRLAKYLETCPAKWMLVIKRTDLIWDLYSRMREDNEQVNILSYDKQYTYNVRGRNDRDVSHLLIKNY